MAEHSGKDPECDGCAVRRVMSVLNRALFSSVRAENGCAKICDEAASPSGQCECQRAMLAHLYAAERGEDVANGVGGTN